MVRNFKLLREKGIAKAEKKSGRDANEGLIGIRVQAEKASIIEVNSETDFVSRNSEFHSLVNSILDISMDNESNTLVNNENVAEKDASNTSEETKKEDKKDEDVVDADFEEIKPEDDKKNAS